MNFLRNFMMGRYGPDQLNVALIIASFAFSLGAAAFSYLIYVSYLLLFLALYRMLSRNIQKRRAENDRFLRFWSPLKQRWKNRKTHKYFRCPSCRNTLRVPRRKGRLQITCPKCGERFIKKT